MTEQPSGTPSESGAVHSVKSGPVTTVILDRPHRRNAVDRPTADALAKAFLDFEADDSAHVAVLWGAGGTFCAGADLKAIAEGPGKGKGNRTVPPTPHPSPLAADAPMGPTRLQLSKPVIAAISGHAVAGGLELACWCDLRVAEDDAVFGVFCRRWGVPLIDGGTVRLPRLIGQSRALDMILTGRPVNAMEAFAMGLVGRVVKPGQARTEAEKLAAEIARMPQACLRHDRSSVYEQFGKSVTEAMAVEFAYGLESLRSAEMREGAARFAGGKGRGGGFDDV
jgi:enoyl-CoA hydratase